MPLARRCWHDAAGHHAALTAPTLPSRAPHDDQSLSDGVKLRFVQPRRFEDARGQGTVAAGRPHAAAFRAAELLVLWLLAVSGSAAAQTAPAAPSNEDCQACHTEGPTAPAMFAGSVHEPLACVDCHADLATVTEFPHPEKLKPVDCSTCHSDAGAQYRDSIHAEGRTRLGLVVAPTCSGCHGTHDILPRQNPASRVHTTKVATTCGTCHAGILREYDAGIHAARLHAGVTGAPTCSTCHSAHAVRRTDTARFQLDVIQECGTCHEDKIRTYRDTFHGQVTALGFERVAKCANCHEAHRVLPASNPASSVSSARLVATCSRCHAGVTARFVKYDPHPNPHDYQRSPVLWWVYRFYTMLMAGCFSFFGLHSLLWFWRSRQERARR